MQQQSLKFIPWQQGYWNDLFIFFKLTSNTPTLMSRKQKRLWREAMLLIYFSCTVCALCSRRKLLWTLRFPILLQVILCELYLMDCWCSSHHILSWIRAWNIGEYVNCCLLIGDLVAHFRPFVLMLSNYAHSKFFVNK